ncbi:hypothetical protein [Paenibacillus odorifer]|uniref:Uncharacterized protein n=1 Tax=Paenibacillus odorifer TaxID=189426 RepID=A0ABX3GTF1_9BACL|nr:hypothetical protein [Paenibacillus odorifer]OMD34803.1 hypothetical protein BSO21_10305 [Paenibacillus odorifer]
MYSVEQLQACDFILKRIINDGKYPFFQKDLKLVVEINGVLWSGDFINFDGRRITQSIIDEDGELSQKHYSVPGNNELPLVNKTWSYYANIVNPTNPHPFWINPFTRINSLPLLFDKLIMILNTTKEDEMKSPLFPYLLNANTLDNKLTLSFMNLSNERLNLVSIIELTQ